jgi:hypothetical protein
MRSAEQDQSYSTNQIATIHLPVIPPLYIELAHPKPSDPIPLNSPRLASPPKNNKQSTRTQSIGPLLEPNPNPSHCVLQTRDHVWRWPQEPWRCTRCRVTRQEVLWRCRGWLDIARLADGHLDVTTSNCPATATRRRWWPPNNHCRWPSDHLCDNPICELAISLSLKIISFKIVSYAW